MLFFSTGGVRGYTGSSLLPFAIQKKGIEHGGADLFPGLVQLEQKVSVSSLVAIVYLFGCGKCQSVIFLFY
jgi:hypothetical protein